MGITDNEFDRVVNYLAETLNEIGLDPSLINEVLAIVATTRTDVVGIPASEGEGTDGA